MTSRGDTLLSMLQAGENNDMANELLKEFFRGYPIERLTLLLQSEQEGAVKAGVWIASELGPGAEPLLDELVRLLSHPLKYVRFFAVDSLFQCADVKAGEFLAEAIQAIDDPEPGVRWKVMEQIARADVAQLVAASGYLTADFVDPPLRALLKADAATLRTYFRDGSERMRRLVAAVAARRALSSGDTALLREVAQTHSELSRFSEDIIEYVQAAGRP